MDLNVITPSGKLDTSQGLYKKELGTKLRRKRPSRSHIQKMGQESGITMSTGDLSLVRAESPECPDPSTKLHKAPVPLPKRAESIDCLDHPTKPPTDTHKAPKRAESTDCLDQPTKPPPTDTHKAPVPVPRPKPTPRVKDKGSKVADDPAVGVVSGGSRPPSCSEEMVSKCTPQPSPKASPTHVAVKNAQDEVKNDEHIVEDRGDSEAKDGTKPLPKPRSGPKAPAEVGHQTPVDSKQQLDDLAAKDPSELTIKEKTLLAQRMLGPKEKPKAPPPVAKKPDSSHTEAPPTEQPHQDTPTNTDSLVKPKKLPPGAFSMMMPLVRSKAPPPAPPPDPQECTTESTSAPDMPGNSAPDMPGNNAPDMPGNSAPNMPGTSAPDMPGTTGPNMPGTSAPNMPGTSAPDMPGTSAPDMPGTSAPDMPGTSAPNEQSTVTDESKAPKRLPPGAFSMVLPTGGPFGKAHQRDTIDGAEPSKEQSTDAFPTRSYSSGTKRLPPGAFNMAPTKDGCGSAEAIGLSGRSPVMARVAPNADTSTADSARMTPPSTKRPLDSAVVTPPPIKRPLDGAVVTPQPIKRPLDSAVVTPPPIKRPLDSAMVTPPSDSVMAAPPTADASVHGDNSQSPTLSQPLPPTSSQPLPPSSSQLDDADDDDLSLNEETAANISRTGDPMADNASTDGLDLPSNDGLDYDQVPNWNMTQVGKWLADSGLGQYTQAFMDRGILGAALLELDGAKLKVGVVKLKGVWSN